MTEREVSLKGTASKTKKARIWGVTSLVAVVLVFGGAVAWVSFSVREEIRQQLMSRDAYVLSLMVQNEIEKAESETLFFSFESLSTDDVWSSLLETSGAQGVFAARWYSNGGELLRSTTQGEMGRVGQERAKRAFAERVQVSVFLNEATLADFGAIEFGDANTFAALAVYLPLHSSQSGEPLGVGAFLLDGQVLQREFNDLDTRLMKQAGVAFGVGLLSILLVYAVAWRRIFEANRQLEMQATRLKKTNLELAMLARTSALGSVTAHLIHGLKNPLAGLRQVVAVGAAGEDALDKGDWKHASEATDRMQKQIQEVVEILQDSSVVGDFGLDVEELQSELGRRFASIAAGLNVDLQTETFGSGELDAHRASLSLLIVSNLIQNALDAVPQEGQVRVSIDGAEERIVFSVSDNGPGLNGLTKDELFAPARSSKQGGAGIGLTISKQLADQIGASLRYLDSGGRGALFELSVPCQNGGNE